MTDAVVPLRPLPKGITAGSPVNESVVAVLEHHLKAARRGEIVGVALATVDPTGCTRADWSATTVMPTVLGGIVGLQFQYARAMVEE